MARGPWVAHPCIRRSMGSLKTQAVGVVGYSVSQIMGSYLNAGRQSFINRSLEASSTLLTRN